MLKTDLVAGHGEDAAASGRWMAAVSRVERLLTTDYCPWVNRYVYWLKQPIGWFLCAAAMCLLVGLFIGPQGFVLCGVLSVVMVVGVVWP